MNLTFLLFLGFALLFGSKGINAQDWQKIEPLVSTCNEVKRIFKVDGCESPVTRLEFEKFTVSIYFKRTSDQWNVSSDTVVWMVVLFKDLPKLNEFEKDLSGYTVSPEYDAPEITIYKNENKGLTLSTQKHQQSELYIDSIRVEPSEMNAKKFRRR